MLTIKDEGIILEKTDLEFERRVVFNPACVQTGEITHMFYRAVDSNDISSIGYCQLIDNKVVKRFDKPVLSPEFDYEKKGIEDPRVTLLEGTYYLFYTAFDGKNARVAYAISNDLPNFTKKGLISPNITYDEASEIFHQVHLDEGYFISKLQLEKEFKGLNFLWEKDAGLFPKKINGQFALNHRIRPNIQIIYFQNFEDLTDDYWSSYLADLDKFTVLKSKYWFENEYIGGGCPPIETKDGWLLIYHTIERSTEGLTYRACAALVDLENPTKVIGRLKEPLFSPKEPWEKIGRVNNVVFPSGAVIKNERLYIYYGAADTCIGAKSVEINDLIQELKKEESK
jgi:predicted GH43/DUF377 family glycosyl hydrolase